MGRMICWVALASVGVPALVGCGLADSRAPLPEFMRAKDDEPPAPEPPPDVSQLVRAHLDTVFMAASAPRDVKVSPARRTPQGLNWTACVRAEVNSAGGQPLGVQTYRIIINDGTIQDRKRVDADDTCRSESYEPI